MLRILAAPGAWAGVERLGRRREPGLASRGEYAEGMTSILLYAAIFIIAAIVGALVRNWYMNR